MGRVTPVILVSLTILLLAQTAMADLVATFGSASVPGAGTLADAFTNNGTQSANDCGCSGALSLGDGSGIIARTNNDCLTGLTVSMVTVLGAFTDDPSLYYGEDAPNGWVALGDRDLDFRFEALGLGGLPFSANIYFDNTPVATIVYPPAYETRPFAVLYQGRIYCGAVFSGDIQMTSVPEPSVSISLVAGIGIVALLGVRHARRSRAG